MSDEISQSNERLKKSLAERFPDASCTEAFGEVTLEVAAGDIHDVCLALRDEADLEFKELIDLCGVDYLAYGDVEWETTGATGTGFSRGVNRNPDGTPFNIEAKKSSRRYAVVYHLLSLTHNERLRVKSYLSDDALIIDSVVDLWSSANWYEREAFDLYGILFDGHPDLRRILTDYGFVGHTFRKDFPLIGHVEMRYDVDKGRVIYEPVSIEPRTLVPRTKRDDHRYIKTATEGDS